MAYKDLHPPFEKRDIKPYNYEITNQHKEIHDGTGNIYTLVLVYKAFHSGNIVKKNKHNI